MRKLPVSYTHLDVYKRQPMNRRLKEIGRLDALKCPTQIHNFATDDESVSYTHLMISS